MISNRVTYSFKERNKFNPITKFLWNCAGADAEILKHCTYGDHVKYACLGAIVVATGFLGALSMFFAIHTIFPPEKGYSIAVPITVGIIWGLIIFNLDRFIVSSTGKGDGQDTISRHEFLNALPRLLMALILGITISAPLEVYMFEAEIDKAFVKANQIKMGEEQHRLDTLGKATIDMFDRDINKLEKEKNQFEKKRQEYMDNAAHENSTEKGGCGPKCNEYKRMAGEEEKKSAEVQAKIDALQAKKDEKLAEKKATLAMLETKYNEKPSLLESITTLEDMEGAAMPVWMVRLMFIFIEIAPVLFKLMLIKSPYDYLEEHVKYLRLAEHGIHKKIELVTTKNGKEELVDKSEFFEYECGLKMKKKLLDAQVDLHGHLVDKITTEKKNDIDSNPDAFGEFKA